MRNTNLDGYGPCPGPMTGDLPLHAAGAKGRVRARMWLDALAAREPGRVRATEIRASDYIGLDSQGPLGKRVVPQLLAGRRVQVLGSADAAHSWSYIGDVARLFVIVGSDPRAWGRPWHVPTNPPRTQREAIADLAPGRRRPAGQGHPDAQVDAAARPALQPLVRELPEVACQMERPFIIDSPAAEAAFGLRPTPWEHVLSETVAFYRRDDSPAAAAAR